MVILNHFDTHTNVTHLLKLGMVREEKRREWLLNDFTCTLMLLTHSLKLGMDQRREKEGVVILSHFHMHINVTHLLKLGMVREEKKREWLFLVIFTCSST